MKQFMLGLKKIAGASAESGQAIVLIALFMVVSLAMTGVAIDGGGLFFLWRDALNAADAAALQAAYDRCTGGTDWKYVGLHSAMVNGFEDPGVDTNGDGEVDTLLENPAVETHATDDEPSGVIDVIVENATDLGPDHYTRAIIKATKPAYFIQLVYRGPLEVSAESVVFCSPGTDYSDMPGAIALGDCSCAPNYPPSDFENDDGGEFSVNWSGSNTNVVGGVHSNCDADMSGSSANFTDGNLDAAEDVDINVTVNGDQPQADAKPITQDPLALDITMYMPGGAIFEQILAETGKAYAIDMDGGSLDHLYTGGANADRWTPKMNGSCNVPYCKLTSNPPRPKPFEGLFYIDGQVDLSLLTYADYYGNLSSPSTQWNGITIVASGRISMPDPDEVVYKFYGHNGGYTGDYGVVAEFPGGQFPALLAFSNFNSFTSAPPCGSNVTGPDSAISVNGQDSDPALDGWGVYYTPRGTFNWNGNDMWQRGVIVAMYIDWTGSDSTWEFDDSLVPHRPMYMNNIH